MVYMYKHFIPQNIAPKGAKNIEVWVLDMAHTDMSGFHQFHYQLTYDGWHFTRKP